ncbi:hypothetical protein GLIP_0416 [Aliiglaciecola lipolytica E3]|uniref:Uncharacterized protein n=1 Tax=Aliiglaciecola lipolytica E3 TaxID=1127673 RepID=K6Y8S7_9ALTE|nr:hypothetical protein GLIP_0416 [Aliiglaciecola lipolytica E3]
MIDATFDFINSLTSNFNITLTLYTFFQHLETYAYNFKRFLLHFLPKLWLNREVL